MTEHDLYQTGDRDAPPIVIDRNGEVVLSLCRRCGQGEGDLGPECPAFDLRDRVSPHAIPLRHGLLWGTFGKLETELSATFIVRLCRSLGGWRPFRKAQLDAIDRKGSFLWNGLDRPEWIETLPDGGFRVTEAFVYKCPGAKYVDDI